MPDTNNSFIDSSSNNFTVTRFGNTTQGSFSPFSTAAGYWSNYFDGSGDYLSIPNNTALVFGTGNFTIEAWIFINAPGIVNDGNARSMTIASCIASSTAGWAFIVLGNSTQTGTGLRIENRINSTTTTSADSSAITITNHQWNHVAAVRNGTTITFYLNGVSVGSGTLTNQSITSSNPLWIGRQNVTNWTSDFNGYISNFRMVKGTALYTTNFTPSTTPLTAVTNTSLLTCQSNRFIDNSTNNFTLTQAGNVSASAFSPFIEPVDGYWSNYFNGSQYLTVPANSAFAFETGDFTVEFWIYKTAAGTAAILDYASAGGFGINITDTQIVPFVSVTVGFEANAVVRLNTWTHVAVTRQGTTLRTFMNGNLVGTSTTSANLSSPSTLNIGRNPGAVPPTFFLNGYLHGLRLIKGTAVYTSNFTPSTTPLTAVSGTSLLTCQNRTFTDGSTNSFTITPVGNAAVSGFGPFTPPLTGYWSNFFNGSTDYLTMSAATVPLTGNFTIEGWVNASAIGARRDFFSQASPSADVSGRLFIYINASGSFEAFVGATPSNVLITHTATVTTSQWYHFAFVRESNVFKFYINGVAAVTQPTNSVSIANFSTIIGTKPLNPTYWSGYISNVRVTSSAVYTANFTPSATPPLAISGTSLLTCQDSALIDRSTNSLSITRTGSVVGSQISPYSAANGYWSNFFDGTGDYLSIPNNTAFDVTASDFTMEAWVYRTVANTIHYIFSWRPALGSQGWEFRINADNTLQFFNNTTGAGSITSTATVPANQWVHVAATRTGNTGRLFINGNLVTSGTLNNGTTTTSTFKIGADNVLAGNFQGYISNARVIKNAALYTASFVPSPTPLTAVDNTSILTCQSNRLIDNSANNFALTRSGDVAVAQLHPFDIAPTIPNSVYSAATMGGSMYFDGSGDKLTVPAGAAFAYGTGAFTIEAWVNTSAYNSGPYDFEIVFCQTVINRNYLMAGITIDGYPRFVYGNSGGTWITGNTQVPLNTWTHLAWVREGTGSNQFKIYMNGVVVATSTVNFDFNDTSYNPTIGDYTHESTLPFKGYISNLRVVKGTAVYTSNFTPSTAPVSAISGTSLLLNGTNGGIVDQTGKINTETVADSKISTAISSKGSMYFDGTGDYLTIPANINLAFGTGDFTAEFWIYKAASGTAAILDCTGVGGFGINIQNTTIVPFASNSIGYSVTGTVPLNTWTHVAVSRKGSSLRTFMDGVLLSTQTVTYNFTSPGPLNIGRNPTTNSEYLNGYINDLRLTKGIARYTANFNPPTRSSA